MKMENIKIIVAGGGASGIIAAGIAALNGASVTLIEKNNTIGKKIKITGKGRCNLTNMAPLNQFLKNFNANPNFVKPALCSFSPQMLIKFFNNLGLETVVERGERVFPKSNHANDVVKVLRTWLKKLKVNIIYNESIIEIIIKDSVAIGIKTFDNLNRVDKKVYGDAIILATGGASYPLTGSTGDGFALCERIGHSIVPILPSLVPLETSGDVSKKLDGLILKNVKASLWWSGKKHEELFGEMIFTNFGMSGPIILSLSNKAVGAIMAKKNLEVSIDLKPALDEKKLDNRLLRLFEQYKNKAFKNILTELLPQKMVPVFLDALKINENKSGKEISRAERKLLKNLLKNFRFQISGFRGFDEAIITAGGISTKEVNPKTMESRLIKNLFFAGEILDFDAKTGGYNIQAAFSTGFLAGASASKKTR